MGIAQRLMCRLMARTVRASLPVASSNSLLSRYEKCSQIYRDTIDDRAKVMITMLQIDISKELFSRGVMTGTMSALLAEQEERDLISITSRIPKTPINSAGISDCEAQLAPSSDGGVSVRAQKRGEDPLSETHPDLPPFDLPLNPAGLHSAHPIAPRSEGNVIRMKGKTNALYDGQSPPPGVNDLMVNPTREWHGPSAVFYPDRSRNNHVEVGKVQGTGVEDGLGEQVAPDAASDPDRIRMNSKPRTLYNGELPPVSVDQLMIHPGGKWKPSPVGTYSWTDDNKPLPLEVERPDVKSVAAGDLQERPVYKHLPFNDFDIAGITNAVNRYKDAGLRCDYDIERKANGVVKIIFDNPMTRDGSLVMFEVHKLARPVWFGEKAWWVVQLWSRAADSETEVRRGCVSGKVQGFALTNAEIDIQHNFLSVSDFEIASRG